MPKGKEWFKPTKNLTVKFTNDKGESAEIYFDHNLESWTQNGPTLIDPDTLDELLKLISERKLWV